MNESTTSHLDGIAIVGLACRFPGAEVGLRILGLLACRESITTFGRDALPPEEPKDDPDYVPRRGVLKDPDAI